MFKRIRIDSKKGMQIRVISRKGKSSSKQETGEKELTCNECGFIAKSKLGLIAHKRKHKK